MVRLIATRAHIGEGGSPLGNKYMNVGYELAPSIHK